MLITPINNKNININSNVLRFTFVKKPKPIEFNKVAGNLLKLLDAAIEPIAPIEPKTTAPLAAIVVLIIAMQPNDVIVLPALQHAHPIFVNKDLFSFILPFLIKVN